MVVGKYTNRSTKKQDVVHLAILLAIALCIGVYLIATTVLIADDGVFYIKMAQIFSNDFVSITKTYLPGYPFLIFLMHKIAAVFSESGSVYTWIYSAQVVSLLSRVLSLVPLYFIGRILVGPRRSFWGLLILIALPYPAQLGSDVVRDWPHILFLSTGLLFLIYGSKFKKWWMFTLAGLIAGLGYTIRAECIQLVIYGILWLLSGLFLKKLNIAKLKTIYLTAALLIGFAIPAVPYMKATEQVLPPKVKGIISCTTPWQYGSIEKNTCGIVSYNASGIPVNILEAFVKLSQRISENLMHFFVLPLVIGFYYHFRNLRKIFLTERFFIFAVVILYFAIMVLLYINHGYISRRHCMPLIVFTAFYIPVGIQIIARWLTGWISKDSLTRNRDRHRCFFIIMAVGLIICSIKFARTIPLRWEKQGYLDAAEWLRKNTEPEDIIAGNEARIGFYAQRPMVAMETLTSSITGGEIIPGQWCHIAGTYDGKYQRLYVNAQLVAADKPDLTGIAVSLNGFAIGKPFVGASSYFQGAVDEVSLYGKALSEKEIETLYNKQISEVNSWELIGYWPLDDEAPDRDGQPHKAAAFDSDSDYLNLSHLNLNFNVDNLSAVAWVKSEMSDNWIMGNRDQFRIGIGNSKARFWIRDKKPGRMIPGRATYLVQIISREQSDLVPDFNKNVKKEHSIWVSERKKKKRIVIYKVL